MARRSWGSAIRPLRLDDNEPGRDHRILRSTATARPEQAFRPGAGTGTAGTYRGRKLTVTTFGRLDAIDADLRIVRRAVAACLPVFLLLAFIGGYLLTALHLAPLQSRAAQAGRIGSAKLHRRLEIGNAATELATLANAFNELLTRVDLSFESMRRFVADASHELRTPVSIIRGEADVALTRDRAPADYRDLSPSFWINRAACLAFWNTCSASPGRTPVTCACRFASSI